LELIYYNQIVINLINMRLDLSARCVIAEKKAVNIS
jgi:hypothetical protein